MKKGFEEGKNAFVKHVGEHIQKGLPADKEQVPFIEYLNLHLS